MAKSEQKAELTASNKIKSALKTILNSLSEEELKIVLKDEPGYINLINNPTADLQILAHDNDYTLSIKKPKVGYLIWMVKKFSTSKKIIKRILKEASREQLIDVMSSTYYFTDYLRSQPEDLQEEVIQKRPDKYEFSSKTPRLALAAFNAAKTYQLQLVCTDKTNGLHFTIDDPFPELVQIVQMQKIIEK